MHGNSNNAVSITGLGTDNNELKGNKVGTDAAGTGAMPNAAGIVIGLQATTNVIGGSGAG